MATVVRKIAGTDPRENIYGVSRPDMRVAVDRGYPGSVFDFNMKLLSLPSQLSDLGATFTRASADTVLQGGQLITLANDQFATDQDTDGGYDYVAQPAATNLCLRSTLEGGGAAPTGWTQPVATGTSAPATSLLGSASNAVAYLQTATAQRPFLMQQVAVLASTTYTWSFFVESNTTLQAQDVIAATGLPVGAVGSFPVCQANPSGGATGALTTGRLTYQVVVAATPDTVDWRMGLGCAGNTTGTIQFSRPQLETGTRASSWIPTTAATATRAAAVLSVPLANIPGFVSSQYTLFADARNDVVMSSLRNILYLDDVTSNNRSMIRMSAGDAIDTQVVSGGVGQASTTEISPATTRFRAAYSVAANSFLRAVNGATGTNDLAGSMPVSPTTLHIGCDFSSAGQFNGRIRRAGIITTALTQAQINGLTA